MASFKVGYATIVSMLLAVAASVLVGCGDGTDDSSSENTGQDGDSGLVVIDAAELPIGDYFPPLDSNRIEIADPLDWKRFARNQEYVARFYKGGQASLPWIIVKASDSPYGIDDVSDENYTELLDAVNKEVAELPSLLETPLPMKIGDNYWIRYVIKAKLRNEGVERQLLVTVLGGRMYEIDLQIRARTIHDHKASSYAVAASLRAAEKSTPAPADAKDAPKKEAPKKEAPKKEAPKKEAPKKEAPKKEAPKKEAPKKDAPKKEAAAKDAPKNSAKQDTAKK